MEHMKSAEHKQQVSGGSGDTCDMFRTNQQGEFDSVSVSSQVHLQEAQEEELITVDAVGCFEGEEDEDEEEEVEVADEEEEGGVRKEDAEEKELEVQRFNYT